MTTLVCADPVEAKELREHIPGMVIVVDNFPALRRTLEEDGRQDLVVFDGNADLAMALEFTGRMRVTRPVLGVVLIRHRVDANVLAEALRSGVREVVKAADLPGLRDACQRSLAISQELRDGHSSGPTEPVRAGKVLTVFSSKGGCGKTTISTNLAVALSATKRVCLVDLDLASGDVAIALQMFPTRTIADAVNLTGSLDESAIRSLVTVHDCGLDIIAAPVEPGGADGIPATLVAGLIQQLRVMYDFVVIDTPPSFTDHVLTAFDESDLQFLLATLDVPALKNLKITLDTLDTLNYPREAWRVVLNRSDAKVGLSLADVENTLALRVFVQVPSSRHVPASINRGVPIVLDSPKHPVSEALLALADSLTNERPMVRVPGPARHRERSLLRRSVTA